MKQDDPGPLVRSAHLRHWVTPFSFLLIFPLLPSPHNPALVETDIPLITPEIQSISTISQRSTDYGEKTDTTGSFLQGSDAHILSEHPIQEADVPPTPEHEVIRQERIVRIKTLFERYNAPLVPHAETFITAAETHDLDWRLLPSIACLESSCGNAIPWRGNTPSYNPFGWGVYGNQAYGFNGWDDAIHTVAKGIKTGYIDKGLTTPEEIEAVYTPSSIERGRTWSKKVHYFMNELGEIE